jgi:hypothetical protein
MGILESLGYKGPFAQFIGAHRNAIGGLGAGIARGRNFGEGIAYGTEGALQGRQADDIFAATKKKEADDALALERAIENMRRYNPQVADMVAAGMPAEAGWNTIMQGMSGMEPTDDMREFEYAQQNPEFAEFLNPPSAPAQPASVQEYEYAKSQGYTGTLLDFQKAKTGTRPVTEAQQRMSMINNIVQDEAKVLLGDPATGDEGVYGALGELGNQVLDANGVGRALTSGDYQRAVSAVETISQHYLYALSGQAAPEGEVKRVARTLMPVVGENAASVLEKKRRLESYLQTIQDFVAQTGGADPAAGQQQQQVTAVNPATGERLVLQNGQWVPAQ